MKMRNTVILSIGITFLLWIGTWLLIWPLSGLVSAELAPKLGQVGDMFGAGSALFSGVAVAAVAVVLLYDVKERRADVAHRETVLETDISNHKNALKNEQQALRPYIVTVINDRDARIDSSQWTANELHVVLVLKVTLRNNTADPALNVKVSSGAGAQASSTASAPLPLSEGVEENIEVSLHYKGSESVAVLQQLLSGVLVVSVTALYESLNGTKWQSRVEFNLSASNPVVREIIPKLVDAESGEFILSTGGVGGGNTYRLKSAAVAESWSQKAMT